MQKCKFRPWRALSSVAVLIAVAALALTACSSSKPASAGADASGSTTGSVSKAVASACQRAKAATAPVSFHAAGGPVDPKVIKGKSIYIVAVAQAVNVVQFTDQMKQAAGLLGATVNEESANGSIEAAVTDIKQAVSSGAAVIIIVAIDPTLLKQALQNAQAKGVTTIDVLNSQPDAAPPPGLDGRVSWNYIQGGKWRMDQAICDTNGKLKLGFISSSDIPVGALQMQGLRSEMKALCPTNCSMTTTDVPSAQWATGLSQAAVNLVQRNPSINYVMPEFGPMVTTVLSALHQQVASGKIKMSSFDQSPDVVSALKSGEIKSDVGTSVADLAWPTLDEALRLMNKQKAVVENVPVRLVTSAVANQLDLSAQDSSGMINAQKIFGAASIDAAYKKLWGLSS